MIEKTRKQLSGLTAKKEVDPRLSDFIRVQRLNFSSSLMVFPGWYPVFAVNNVGFCEISV